MERSLVNGAHDLSVTQGIDMSGAQNMLGGAVDKLGKVGMM